MKWYNARKVISTVLGTENMFKYYYGCVNNYSFYFSCKCCNLYIMFCTYENSTYLGEHFKKDLLSVNGISKARFL